ncbi:MAG: Tim44 domain-containing protein [Burkholderiaceae bacterium]
MMKFWSLMLAMVMLLAGLDANAARRLGGGGSVGKQSSQVTKKSAPDNAQAKPQTPAAAGAAAAAPRRPWGAMLGGLAAGLGLAWLASSLGFGEEFGNILLFGLLAFGVMAAVGWFLRRRLQGSRPGSLAMQGAGANSPRQYSEDHVGNDASARPWERSSMAFQADKFPADASRGGPVAIGSALARSTGWGIPADFDSESFLAAAKRHFITLQSAWDRADIATLQAMMTDAMLAEIQSQLREREAHTGGQQPNKTEVMVLEAQLLGIEEEEGAHIASVEFSGMIREDVASGPNPFREVWNLSKSKDGVGGWLVAGVQALQ